MRFECSTVWVDGMDIMCWIAEWLEHHLLTAVMLQGGTSTTPEASTEDDSNATSSKPATAPALPVPVPKGGSKSKESMLSISTPMPAEMRPTQRADKQAIEASSARPLLNGAPAPSFPPSLDHSLSAQLDKTPEESAELKMNGKSKRKAKAKTKSKPSSDEPQSFGTDSHELNDSENSHFQTGAAKNDTYEYLANGSAQSDVMDGTHWYAFRLPAQLSPPAIQFSCS